MRRCEIPGCKHDAFARGVCLRHLLVVGRIALSAYRSDKRTMTFSSCKYQFGHALKKVADKAFVDSQWASIPLRIIDRQLEISRAFPEADFPKFAAECVVGPSGTARRKAALETELKQIATKHGFEMTDGQHYHKSIKKAIAHAAKNNGTHVRWDIRKARRRVEDVIS